MEAGVPLDARGVPGQGPVETQAEQKLRLQLRSELEALQNEIASAPATVVVPRALGAALELLVRDMDRYTEAVARQDLSAAHALEAGNRWHHVLAAWVLVKRLRRSKPLTYMVALADVELRAIASFEEGAAFSGGELVGAPGARQPGSQDFPPVPTPPPPPERTHNAHDAEFPREPRQFAPPPATCVVCGDLCPDDGRSTCCASCQNGGDR